MRDIAWFEKGHTTGTEPPLRVTVRTVFVKLGAENAAVFAMKIGSRKKG